MPQYMSEVLAATPATIAPLTTPPSAEPVTASGGTGGASYPVLKEGDVKEPAKAQSRKLKLSKAATAALASKVAKHNAECSFDDEEVTLDMLASVYRRGAGSYAAADTGTLSLHDWAMTRVDSFSNLMLDPSSVNPSYVADFDLLPFGHEKSTMSMTASADYTEELTVTLYPSEEDYESQEHAIFSLAEFSGLGYETIPAIRASWMRAVKNNENPYERAALLASALYDSPDADLLPMKGIL